MSKACKSNGRVSLRSTQPKCKKQSEELKIKEEQKHLISLFRQQQPLDQRERQILYELLTHIGTKLTITDEEQELLLYAGQLIVKMREGEIRRALISR